MERILSKDEIAELLSAVKQGDVETESAPMPREARQSVSRLDLVKLPGHERWKIPNLDIIFDSFGRNYGISLTNRLQRPVSLEFDSVNSMSFEESIKTVAPNSAIAILGLDPFKTGGLLIFDGSLAFSALEIQLGGATEGKITVPNRPLTAIEINLLRMIMNDSCADLQKAFNPLEKINATLVKIENNPRLVNIVTSDSGVLVIRFKANFESHSGRLELIVPHASLEPLREKLRDRVLSISTLHGETWPEALIAGVNQVYTTVAAQLGEITLKVRDILNFQEGDIIDLGTGPKVSVKLLVEGQPKFQASAGTRNGSKAVRINQRIQRSE